VRAHHGRLSVQCTVAKHIDQEEKEKKKKGPPPFFSEKYFSMQTNTHTTRILSLKQNVVFNLIYFIVVVHFFFKLFVSLHPSAFFSAGRKIVFGWGSAIIRNTSAQNFPFLF
jgi:hypothetical protein